MNAPSTEVVLTGVDFCGKRSVVLKISLEWVLELVAAIQSAPEIFLLLASQVGCDRCALVSLLILNERDHVRSAPMVTGVVS